MRFTPVRSVFALAIAVWAAGAVPACVGDEPGAAGGGPDACGTGAEGCACTSGGACNPGLFCASNVCVRFDAGSADAPSGSDGQSGADGSGVDGGGGDGGDAAPSDADAGPSRCGLPLHPDDAGSGPYCPFTVGGNVHCAGGQICCEPSPDASSTCQAPTGCAGISWQCTDHLDCPSGTPICCASTNAPPTSDPAFPDCGTAYALPRANFIGTTCVTTCTGANTYTLCERTSDCPMDKACGSLRVAGTEFGLCL